MWSNNDPRIEISKTGNIVILRKDELTGRLKNVGHAVVDTKESWSIITSYEDIPVIGSHDKWNNTWLWCLAP